MPKRRPTVTAGTSTDGFIQTRSSRAHVAEAPSLRKLVLVERRTHLPQRCVQARTADSDGIVDRWIQLRIARRNVQELLVRLWVRPYQTDVLTTRQQQHETCQHSRGARHA